MSHKSQWRNDDGDDVDDDDDDDCNKSGTSPRHVFSDRTIVSNLFDFLLRLLFHGLVFPLTFFVAAYSPEIGSPPAGVSPQCFCFFSSPSSSLCSSGLITFSVSLFMAGVYSFWRFSLRQPHYPGGITGTFVQLLVRALFVTYVVHPGPR